MLPLKFLNLSFMKRNISSSLVVVSVLLALLLAGCGPGKEELRLASEAKELRSQKEAAEKESSSLRTKLSAAELSVSQRVTAEEVQAKRIAELERESQRLKASIETELSQKKISEDRQALLREQIADLQRRLEDNEKAAKAAAMAREEQLKTAEAERQRILDAERNKIVLEIQAGLTYRSGDTKPVATTDFFLLKESLASIISQYGFKDAGDFFTKLVVERMVKPGKAVEAYNAMVAKSVARVRTDFSGKGQFENISAGEYFIVGMANYGRSYVVWDHPKSVAAGKNALMLSVDNSAFAM
jgi:hypothetical protein